MGKAALKTMTQEQINTVISYLKRALYSLLFLTEKPSSNSYSL